MDACFAERRQDCVFGCTAKVRTTENPREVILFDRSFDFFFENPDLFFPAHLHACEEDHVKPL
jgi:hypothetical protein